MPKRKREIPSGEDRPRDQPRMLQQIRSLLIVDHDRETFRIMTEEVERVWGDTKPAMTLIPVPALALEGMLVEIDVLAAVPA